MFTKIFLAIALLACGSVYSADVELQPIMQQHQRAMQMLVRTFNASPNAQGVQAADVSINECFDYYNTAQAAITEKYNKAYNGCVDTATTAKAALSEQSSEQRAALVKNGQTICSDLSACEENSDGLAFFKCYHKASNDNITPLFTISADSESAYNTLSVQYQKIDDDQTVCTTSAKNEYVTELSTCASNLNNCLLGEWVPPSDSTTTDSTSTDTTTPETTTTDTTTPETSSSSESTTEAVPAETTDAGEEAPEEDVMRYRPMTRMNMWNILRRL